MKGVVVHCGIRPEDSARAARLYWEAFADKLGVVLRPETRALAWLEDCFQPDHAFGAYAGGELIGIAGFRDTRGGIIAGDSAVLIRHYGTFGGLWRALALWPLERCDAPDVLGLDGMCVAEDWRGQGVGSALIDAALAHARARHYSSVSLDVIAQNRAAARLYARHGFRVMRRTHLGPLGRLYGFAWSENMRCTL